MAQEHWLDWITRVDGDRPALGDSNASVTYSDLIERSQSMAGTLSRTHPDARYVFLRAERAIPYVEALLAVGFAGKVPIPIDPDAPKAYVDAVGAKLPDSYVTWDYSDAVTGPVLDQRRHDIPALLLLTSGTSGTPKIVPVSQDNLSHSVRAISAYLDYHHHNRAAVVLPLHYSYALLSQLLCMLYVGGYAHIFANARNPVRIAAVVRELGLSNLCGVPSTFDAFHTIHQMSPLQFESVRVLCSAGAAFDCRRRDDVLSMFPNATLFNNYGMTEATPRVTYINHLDERFASGSCGRPIEGVTISIRSEDGRRALPDGEIGIVAVKGPNVFSGYLGDPAATEAAFSPDGFLLSGDVGYLDGGYLYVKGRRDEVFNVGGEKVSPAEIESGLNDHEAVSASAVYPFSDPKRGRVPYAYLVLSKQVSKRELTAFLRTRLPPSKLPWKYFEVNRLPTTSNGKLQRARLHPEADDLVVGEIR